jgi:ubiquinone/menaquinone biosynthesis C-methylase UbiE
VGDSRLDTAYEVWNRWWGEAKERAHWSEPEPAVVTLVDELKARGAERVLDVGTGIGRHAVALARAGLRVTATDASETGLLELARVARDDGLQIDLRLSSFTALPVRDSSVDHVLAWNVLYHGDGDVVRAAFAECRRVP